MNKGIVVLLVLCLLGLVVPTPVAGHHGSTGPDGHPINFTWTPYDLSSGGVNNHRPGIDNATHGSFSSSESPDGFEKLAFVTVHATDVDMSGCSSRQTRVFGIDRNSDDSGTTTDESLLDNYERSSFTEDWIVVDFYESEDLAGDPAYINGSDELVSVIADCFGNPDDPGWYQVRGKLNGTTWEGERKALHPWSHYFYICECQTRAEAVEKLGKPPSQREGTPAPTATPTATAASPRSPTATATATPTTTPVPRATATSTTPDRPAEEPAGSPTPTEATDTATRSVAAGTATTASAAVPQTPTLAEGAGFGGFLALLGLLAGAVLTLRG